MRRATIGQYPYNPIYGVGEEYWTSKMPHGGEENEKPSESTEGCDGGSERDRSADLTIFSRSLYQLSYRAMNS